LLFLFFRLRYYPVLASLQLRNITARFFVCLYILGDLTYAIVREGLCMGFLPLSRYYSALEEAKLRVVSMIHVKFNLHVSFIGVGHVVYRLRFD
jgi:hypothetical protein